MIILFRHSDNTHNTHSALNQRRQWNILLFVWSITKRFGERELIRESGARIVFNRVIKFDIVILEPWSAHQRIKERKRRFSHFLGESRAYVELWITRQNMLFNYPHSHGLLQFQHFEAAQNQFVSTSYTQCYRCGCCCYCYLLFNNNNKGSSSNKNQMNSIQ